MKLTDEMVALFEDSLAADKGGNLAREVLRSLSRLESYLIKETHKLQRPEDYRLLEAASGSVQAAQHVMALYLSAEQ